MSHTCASWMDALEKKIGAVNVKTIRFLGWDHYVEVVSNGRVRSKHDEKNLP